jgi:hypothetical protein
MSQSAIPLPPEFDLLCQKAALDDMFCARPDLESDYDIVNSSTECPEDFRILGCYRNYEYDLIKFLLGERYEVYYNLVHKVVALCGTSI